MTVVSMISYALNHEDVLLDRVFPRAHRGFYVDIGANDPVVHSVTKHFYDLGWSGINVEPNAQMFVRLREARERDVNVEAAISEEEGELAFFELEESASGISTLSAHHATRHRDSGFPMVERRVRTMTLAQLCAAHLDGHEVDFMSIDVEGHERQVIQGGDWRRWRPRILVVEAVDPLTTVAAHGDWEPTLLEADYVYATFDGLNRYYVRAEEAGLAEALRIPVNVNDDYVEHASARRLQELNVAFETVSGQLAAARTLNGALVARVHGFAEELGLLRARYERAERALLGLVKRHAETLEVAARTEALVAEVRAELAVAARRADEANALFAEVGPASLGLARRLGQLARRYPKASASVRSGLLAGLRVKRAVTGGRR